MVDIEGLRKWLISTVDDEKLEQEKKQLISLLSTQGAFLFMPQNLWDAFKEFCKETYDVDVSDYVSKDNG